MHDKQRGKGSFDRTIRGIENLLKHNRHVSTYTTVTRNNYQDIEDIIILGKSLGLAAVKFNELLPLGNAVCHLPNLTLSNSQRRALTHKLEGLRNTYGNFVIGTILDMGNFFKGFEKLEKIREPGQSGMYEWAVWLRRGNPEVYGQARRLGCSL